MPKSFLVSYTDYQAKMGLEGLKRFKEDTKKRSDMGYLLYSKLKKASVPGLIYMPSNAYCTFWRFPLWVENKNKFRISLFKRYIDSTVSGLECCSREPAFKEFNRDTPEAFKFMDNMIFLPIHPKMDITQVEHIINAVREYYGY